MNIKITYNWLLDYLDTDASPYEIQKYLSLCGPSVERVEKTGDDYVFEIEITSNRVDAASVLGIAQEAQAILPQFGKKARLKLNPLKTYTFKDLPLCNDRNIVVNIRDKNLCSRFTAIILTNVQINQSPDLIKKRLILCGIKSINNVIDISNYLMLAMGQPTHIFDYDKIKNHQMILRESKKGEKITTLDGKEFTLSGGDIVIEDGSGNLIDLCGIMGGLNSAVDNKTRNIVLFVQTYNKERIRKTSMTLGQRTVAATYFEKGLDEERVEPTLGVGLELLQRYAKVQIASPPYDIYPHPYKSKTLTVNHEVLEKKIGVKIPTTTVTSILNKLNFTIHSKNNLYTISIPSYRKNDIAAEEDIVEEIARIYGYHNLPKTIQPTIYIKQPKEIEATFAFQEKIKPFLKTLGLSEVMNYSMISKILIDVFQLKEVNHLTIKNTISKEIKYLRTTLIPSLVKNIKDNQGKKDILKLFEIAKIYLPQKDDLPEEKYQLAIATNTDFFDLKGIVEVVLRELNIENPLFESSSLSYLERSIQTKVVVGKTIVGYLGQLRNEQQLAMGLKNPVFVAELDVEKLINSSSPIGRYQPINPFAQVKLDLTIEMKKGMTYSALMKALAQLQKSTLPLLQNWEFVSLFKNKITLRFYFAATNRNITEEEAKEELEKIKLALERG